MPRGTRQCGKSRQGLFLETPEMTLVAIPMTSLSSDYGLMTHWPKEDIAYNASRTVV